MSAIILTAAVECLLFSLAAYRNDADATLATILSTDVV